MRVGIVGAGAIGGWIGVRLARRGHDVSVFARGLTLDALRQDGWRLDIGGETVSAPVIASADASELGVQDVVLISVKGPALAAVAPLIAPLIGASTLVVPMMNGVPWWFLLGGGGELAPTDLRSVDADRTIAAALPYDQVIGNVVHAAATVQGPGHVVHRAGNRLIFGEPGGEHSARLEQLCAMFEDAGFVAESSDRIRYEIWYKLWGNMTMNPISAVAGVTCDRILDDPLVAGFVLQVMTEAQAIGARIGCVIAERGEDRNAVTRQLGAFKTSMLQDAEAGRPLEIDQLLSAPREIAGKLGMETPMLDALTGLTRLFAQRHGLYPA
jgi:2-dehydropantoate 2-reductase